MSTRVQLWLLRAAWGTLPLTAGPSAASALEGWSSAPRWTAGTLLWVGWAIGLLAALAPRPLTLTGLRIVGPAFVALTVAAACSGRPSTVATLASLLAVTAAATAASSHGVSVAAANAVAYGDEERFPLRIPTSLFLGPLPGARAAVAAGVATGPVLLADGNVIAGVLAVLIGTPLAIVGARAAHGLSRRCLVLVPAGVVVLDPLTLADPVLFVREHVVALGASAPRAVHEAALDLRLGAVAGSVRLALDEPAELLRSARGRHGGQLVQARELLCAVVRRHDFLRAAAVRRLPVTEAVTVGAPQGLR